MVFVIEDLVLFIYKIVSRGSEVGFVSFPPRVSVPDAVLSLGLIIS